MAGQGGSEKSGEQTIPKYMHDIYIYINHKIDGLMDYNMQFFMFHIPMYVFQCFVTVFEERAFLHFVRFLV